MQISSAVATASIAALAALPITVGWTLFGIGLATLLGGLSYVVYGTVKGTYHKLINSPDALLDLAINEVSQWPCSTTNKDNSTETVSKEKKLEFLGQYENLTRA
jgi:hypothetical protein